MSSFEELPRVVLRPRRALPFFNRHPWVFAGAVSRIEGDPEPGDEVAVVTDRGEFVARGLVNPTSNIRVRLYSWDRDRPLDRAFWAERIDAAVRLRESLFPEANDETGYRAIFSEADGLSGLVVDRYGPWLAVQVTSLALGRRLDEIVELLSERLTPRGMRLRTEKGTRDAEGLEIEDGPLAGEEPEGPIFVDEGGTRFGIDLARGQKTGFYLDQRDNRATLCRHTRDARVLDLFCYSGGFGITALARGGAKRVHGIDVSESALRLAEANLELNGLAGRATYTQADVFDALESLATSGERYDVVVLDPPKMTRHRKGVEKALKGYYRLNRLAVDVLAPGGVLLTCSCSGHVDRSAFLQMLSSVAREADRPIQVLESRGASPDHPTSVACLETDYLQCYVCRVL